MKSKFKQGSEDYLIEQCDIIIGQLVKEKRPLFKAYNYYQGFRDKYQFEHLEQNYGMGNPTSVKFTPLVKKHVDAIVGEYLTTKIAPKISCKDEKTLTNILRDKELEVAKRNKEWVSQFLENSIYNSLSGKRIPDKQQIDPIIDAELKRIQDDVEINFISAYEEAAQDIIQFILQSRRIDFKNKIQALILDLLIGGQAYYKVKSTASKTNFDIEVTDPLNTFVFTSTESKYMKDGIRAVVRKWLTREEIGIKYGKYLDKEDLDNLECYNGYKDDNERLTWIAALNSRGCSRTSGILGGIEVSNFLDDELHYDLELIPVYEVEWIDYDRKNQKGILYNVTRIGSEIYILSGQNKDMVRTQDDPDNIRLSINGMFYTNRAGIPYSLMLATADLQDLYDLTMFQKDNLIAQSGVKGAYVNEAALPTSLGKEPKERLLKYIGWRKMGIALIDTSQEGEAPVNTYFNGFDDTLSLNAIQGYQISLQMIEDTVSSITGVFRERLGGIQQRDAVANVEVGMQQSYIITKQYYQAMDTLVSEILVDCLNIAKKVYKKGFAGEVILGDRKEIFTLLPEHYTFTDYDIHLADSTELIKQMEVIKQLAIQLAGQGQVDPELLIIVSTSQSYTELKNAVRKAIQEKKLENNQVQQLQQQLQQAQQNMQQMQKQLEASTKKIQQLDERKLAIEQQNNQMQQNINWQKVKGDQDLKQQELDLIKQRNQIEYAELLDNNAKNDEVQDKKY